MEMHLISRSFIKHCSSQDHIRPDLDSLLVSALNQPRCGCELADLIYNNDKHFSLGCFSLVLPFSSTTVPVMLFLLTFYHVQL